MNFLTLLSLAVSASVASALGPLGGVNTAGYDFTVTTDGSFSGTGQTPPPSQYAHFTKQGANLYRIPFAWQLMTPQVGGVIDEGFFQKYDATVKAALSSGSNVHVIVDLHNYARWNGGIIAQGGPSNDQFVDFWSKLASKYKDNDRIIFGIMNEPHDLDVPTWANTVQLAINGIRKAGAKSQYLLLPGSTYASAGTFPTEAGPLFVKLTDPAGGKDKLIFDVHAYLDYDYSGTHAECTRNGVSDLQTLVDFLKSNGNRQAILSETGGGNTASCEQYLKQELAFVKNNPQQLAGFSTWAAGAFDTSYVLSETPNADGSDQPIWTNAVKPNLPN
ncbi:hypothetical protein CONPUDRAFT_180565 [Coniophora puteana RWD-64-598 SS2]|uniref:cellulase n=1 Tax=Coniophora puteana (strain RWD-64-598) TaxID=741705 RepID=A0A5M3N825_CONPW|nr:uncharacterized protein CONPUDRAFT_180565 [Coniophora puteana RWD-64-598 SS2]EIW87466.1 hypothetical protein CONPUDRAFT_180565 [Coniophora puteana RWD-64-598 SS2]